MHELGDRYEIAQAKRNALLGFAIGAGTDAARFCYHLAGAHYDSTCGAPGGVTAQRGGGRENRQAVRFSWNLPRHSCSVVLTRCVDYLAGRGRFSGIGCLEGKNFQSAKVPGSTFEPNSFGTGFLTAHKVQLNQKQIKGDQQHDNYQEFSQRRRRRGHGGVCTSSRADSTGSTCRNDNLRDHFGQRVHVARQQVYDGDQVTAMGQERRAFL